MSILVRVDGVSVFSGILLSLWVVDGDVVWDWVRWSVGTCGVVWEHDLDLASHDSLFEEDVSGGNIQVVQLGLSGTDHISLLEFHGLSSLLSHLSGDDDLTSTSTTSILHDSLDDGLSGHSDWDVSLELGLQVLYLGGSAQTSESDWSNSQRQLLILISESLLDQLFEFLDLLSINSEDFLWLNGLDSDFGLINWGLSDFDTSISSLNKSLG